MNIVLLSGNITKMYDNTNNMRIVIADNFKDRSEYIPVACFGGTADHVRRNMAIGDHVSIEGRASIYKDNNGVERLTLVANRVSFEGYRNPRKAASVQGAPSQQPYTGGQMYGNGVPEQPDNNGFIPLDEAEEKGDSPFNDRL